MSLTYIGEQITLYTGSILFIAGIFGNGMNILIFSTIRNYRTTPASFYCLFGSIINTLYLLIFLTTRIVTAANGIDLTRTSLAWCKTRPFFVGFLAPLCFTCSCLATIDQFFVTSHHANIRRLSNIKWAHRILIISIIFWSIHGLFGPIFYEITSVRCTSTNAIYAEYSVIYSIVIVCAIPILIIGLFGLLTFRNIRQTILLAEQRADQQLTKMILIQILLILVSIAPYGINNAYRLITAGVKKGTDQQVKEAFITTIVTLISYLYYVVCLIFIVFFLSLINSNLLFREVSIHSSCHQVDFVVKQINASAIVNA